MKTVLQSRGINSGESGSSLIEAVVILLVLLVMFAGAADLGVAFYYSNTLQKAADAGALYGSQNPMDTTGMVQAATADAQDVPGMSATAIYGCECSDGSAQSPSCSTTPSCSSGVTETYYVSVTTQTTYKPLVPWPGIPSSYNLASTVTLPTQE